MNLKFYKDSEHNIKHLQSFHIISLSSLIFFRLALVLLNSVKYSEEINTMETGFDTPNRTHEGNFDDGQWSQFRME